MKKLNLFFLVGVCVALMPAVALAGVPDAGACYVVTTVVEPDGDFNVAGCADGLTAQQCDSVDQLTDFAPGATCAEVAGKGGFAWDGSCDASIDPVGDVCIDLWTEQGALGSAALCTNDIGGSWSAGVLCQGVPVPTLPGFGMAALAMLILAGALIILTMRGSLPTA